MEAKLSLYQPDTLVFILHHRCIPGEGLKNEAHVNAALKEGKYIEVLKALWSEGNQTRRLVWLRQKAELDVFLLLELGLEEFKARPAVETIHTVAMPLFHAALFRAKQDLQCSNDPSVHSAIDILSFSFNMELKNLVLNALNQKLDIVLNTARNVRYIAVIKKVKEVAEKSLLEELPHPLWVAQHGMGKWLMRAPLKPQEEWNSIRCNYAELILKH